MHTMLLDIPARLDPGAPVVRSEPDAGETRLGLLIGQRRWLVSLAEAGEIVPLPPIAPVPLTRDWFRGLVNLRGTLFTVIDLARFAGDPATPIDKDARLLAVGARLQFNTAILVSKMLGLRSTGGMQLRTQSFAAPQPQRDAWPPAAWQGAVWIDDAGAHWQELSLARLVQDESFLQVGR